MEIVDLFIYFINAILKFKIFDISLINYLIIFAGIIFVFKIINIIGNNGSNLKSKKIKESDKKWL